MSKRSDLRTAGKGSLDAATADGVLEGRGLGTRAASGGAARDRSKGR